MDILSTLGTVIFTSAATIIKDAVIEAVSKRANLCNANLRGSDLCGSDLRGANLRNANLRGSNLCNANLRGSNLCNANLYNANLYGANLCGSNLCNANLCNANLYNANLYGANLCGSNLCNANLYGSNLCGSDLYGADGEKKKVHSLRSYSSSLYPYLVLAVLFEDGERMVKMGCLEKTVAQWDALGIRKSNVSEFPNDGSEICEDRAGLFELAKATAIRMTLPATQKAEV